MSPWGSGLGSEDVLCICSTVPSGGHREEMQSPVPPREGKGAAEAQCLSFNGLHLTTPLPAELFLAEKANLLTTGSNLFLCRC